MVKDDHPEYFSKIFIQFDSSANVNRKGVINALDSAIKVAPAIGAGDKVEIYKRKFEYFIDVVKEYEKAYSYADSIQIIAEDRIKDQRFAYLYAYAIFRKGDVYSFLKNYEQSIKYYIEGKQFVTEKVKDQCLLSGYNGRIGNMIFRQGRYLLAARYYLEGFYEEQSCQKDPFLKYVYCQGNLNNVGICYYRVNMIDSANSYFTKAMAFIEAHEHEFPQKGNFIKMAKAVTNANFARVADKQGKFEEAEQLYIGSIANSWDNDADYAHATQLDLAQMYITSNQLDKAEKLVNEITPSFNHLLVRNSQLQWNRLLSDLYDKKNQPHISHKFLQHYFFIRDSIDEAEKINVAMDVGREFENREQKAVNQLLKKENETTTVRLAVAILLTILALVIILFVLFNLRRTARYARELEKLNIQVQQKNINLQALNGEIQLKNRDVLDAYDSLENSYNINKLLIRTVAHDLKNPLNATVNLVRSVSKKVEDAEIKETLELIGLASANSLTLINDMIKTDSLKYQQITMEMNDIFRLLEYCVELMQPRADEKEQKLTLEGESAEAYINKDKMWRVITNIINNAIKFSYEKGIINVKLEKKEAKVLLSIQDEGIGIPDDLKDKIFEASPLSQRAGTAGEESYGLGLFISRKIIEEHNGRLWFESEAGKGSIFYIELPSAN